MLRPSSPSRIGQQAATAVLHLRRWRELGRRSRLPARLRPYTGFDPSVLPFVTEHETVERRDTGRDVFAVGDLRGSTTVGSVVDDLRRDAYRFDLVDLGPGDVVVDVGAHVGVVAMSIARRFPGVVVYALEPMPTTFLLLKRNLGRNRVANVIPLRLAVTGDGRPLHLQMWPDNTGGATGFLSHRSPVATSVDADAITLDDLFDELAIDRCGLLKIDCEGAEHDILPATRVLDRVDDVRAEFHINDHLASQGHSIETLAEHVRGIVGADHLVYEACRMAD